MHAPPRAHPPMRAGFTLTEMVFTLAIGTGVLAALIAVMITQMTQYRQMRDATEMQQNAHVPMAQVLRDIRMAGYGLPVSVTQLPLWITWVSGMTNPVVIRPGSGTAPDRLLLAGAFGAPAAALQSGSLTGAKVIQVRAGEGAQFNTTNRKLVFIDNQELARITAISGDLLTITTHVSLTGRGLRFSHPAGAPLELVKILEYGCEPSATNVLRRPLLFQDDHRGLLTNSLQQVVALGIDDFQASSSNNTVYIQMSALSQHAERGYTDPVHGDAYRRIAIRGSALPRNRRN